MFDPQFLLEFLDDMLLRVMEVVRFFVPWVGTRTDGFRFVFMREKKSWAKCAVFL